MKIRNMGIVTLAVFSVGCAQRMYFVKPGAMQKEFREACKACEQEVVSIRVQAIRDHGAYRDYPASGRGVAYDHTVRGMSETIALLIAASRAFDSDERGYFKHCMKRHGWTFQEEESKGDDSFCFKK